MPTSVPPLVSRLVFFGLVIIVALAPLPLGSNRPLPVALLLAAAGMLLIVWSAYAAFVKGANPGVRAGQLRSLAAPALLYSLVLAWIFLQSIPFAATGMFQTWGHPLWNEASNALAAPLAHSISINPAATIDGGFRLVAYAALFWLTLQLTHFPALASQARIAIIVVGSAYSLYGLFVLFGGEAWLLGNVGARPGSSLTSSFVNRNSYATFAGLSLLAALSLFLERVRHLLALKSPARRKAALVIEHIVFQSRLLTAATLTIALALFLTTSRGGIFASLFALVALILLQLPSQSGRARQPLGIVVLVVMGIAVLVGGGNFADRLEQKGLSLEADLRSTLFVTTIDAIKTVPLTGTGFGTYEQAIEPYRANDPNLFAIWEKAHNSYLENALELGLFAAVALNVSLLLLAFIAYRGVRTRRRYKSFPALGVAATLLVGLHALVDFSLQIPAVALLYAFIMGLAVAQSFRADEKPSQAEA